MIAKVGRELRFEPLARRVDDDDLGIARGLERRGGGARRHRHLGPIGRRELLHAERESLQRVRSQFVQADFAHAVQHRQSNGADAGIEFGYTRLRGDTLTHVLDDALRDVQIALTEGAGG